MAVTIVYKAPYNVAPTVLQQKQHPRNLISGTLTALAADTTAVITHNFGLTAAQLAEGAPFCNFCPLSDPVAGPPVWYKSAADANTVTFSKGTADAGTLTEFQVNRVLGTPSQ